MIETASRWLKQALHDLQNAKKNFKIKSYDVTLILCQQAIEKALKAYYYQKFKKNPPRTHSLEKLVELVEISSELDDLIVELDDYYFALRYPDVSEKMPYELCDREDAESGLEKAGKILRIIEQKIAIKRNEKKN